MAKLETTVTVDVKGVSAMPTAFYAGWCASISETYCGSGDLCKRPPPPPDYLHDIKRWYYDGYNGEKKFASKLKLLLAISFCPTSQQYQSKMGKIFTIHNPIGSTTVYFYKPKGDK